MTANELLSLEKAGDLFSNDAEQCKIEYRNLVKKWHPDINSFDTSNVLEKINELYQQALQLISEGKWEKTNCVQFKTNNGKSITINYLYQREFELGTCFVGNKYILYSFDNSRKKYYEQMLSSLSQLKYSNDEMKKEFEKYFPKVIDHYVTTDNRYIAVVEKTEDVYPMELLLKSTGNKIPDKHVAWMISRLMNIVCYFNYTGVVHNGIRQSNCYVSPKLHTIFVGGGWWYTTKTGQPMLGTSKDIFEVMPVSAKSTKTSSIVTDIESVKLLGRQLLGDQNCRTLAMSNLAPAAFIDFLVSGSDNDPLKEMTKWDNALESAYGKRHFIAWEVTKEQIYSKENLRRK